MSFISICTCPICDGRPIDSSLSSHPPRLTRLVSSVVGVPFTPACVISLWAILHLAARTQRRAICAEYLLYSASLRKASPYGSMFEHILNEDGLCTLKVQGFIDFCNAGGGLSFRRRTTPNPLNVAKVWENGYLCMI